MPFHVMVHWPQDAKTRLFNLSAEKVEERIVEPWNKGHAVVVRGKQYNRGHWMASIYEYPQVPETGNDDISRWVRVTMSGKDVTDRFIKAPYGVDATSPERDDGNRESAAISEQMPDAVDPRTVMVVHGRDLRLRDEMFNFLRALGLSPLEWSQLVSLTGEGSPYVGQVLERAFEVAQAAVVLFSPDDEVRLRADLRGEGDSDSLEGQARPNVFFEAGLAFGRFPEKTVLVELGKLRDASDLAGRHVLRLDGSAERRHELAERLANAGCPVDRSGSDWLRVGDFGVS